MKKKKSVFCILLLLIMGMLGNGYNHRVLKRYLRNIM